MTFSVSPVMPITTFPFHSMTFSVSPVMPIATFPFSSMTFSVSPVMPITTFPFHSMTLHDTTTRPLLQHPLLMPARPKKTRSLHPRRNNLFPSYMKLFTNKTHPLFNGSLLQNRKAVLQKRRLYFICFFIDNSRRDKNSIFCHMGADDR